MSRHVALLRNDKTQHASPYDDDNHYINQTDQGEEAAAIVDEPSPEELAAAESRKTRLLAISFFLMIIFGLGNKATQILQLDYINYPLFLSLITTAIYIPASFVYIVPVFYMRNKPEHAEQRAIPMKTWFMIGGLDSLAGIMQIITISIIKNGTLIVLLSQTAIPISMVCSRFFLGAKYTTFHYVGVSIVLAGLLIVLLPRFLIKQEPDPDAPSSGKLLGSILIFVLAGIPQCLSTVYKEISLGETDVDPIYLNGWVAVWQLVLSFPLLIPSAWALYQVGDEAGVPLKELPRNLWEGAKCWCGINSYTAPSTSETMLALGALYYTSQGLIMAANQLKALQAQINENRVGAGGVDHDQEAIATTTFTTHSEFVPHDVFTTSPFASTLLYDEHVHTVDEATGQIISTTKLSRAPRKTDNCSKAPIYTNLYMAFNIVYNILIILLIKYGSANLLFMCLTITLPLSSVFFSLHLPFIKKPKPFTKWDVMGLVVLLSGIVIYRFWKPIAALIWGPEPKAEDDMQENLLGNDNNNNMITSDNYNNNAGNINSTYQSNYQKQIENQPPYYGEVNANVDDPFGDQEAPDNNHDGYETAEVATQFTTSSSNASDTTNHGRKKVKKGRK